MAIDREELKKQAVKAASAEEILEIIQTAGEEITAEQAEQLLEKAQKQKEQQELSLDELDAVSGGADLDWLEDGCAATVEPDSWCWTNDKCHDWEVTYSNITVGVCTYCAKELMEHIGFDAELRRIYRCPGCGKTITVEAVEYNATH